MAFFPAALASFTRKVNRSDINFAEHINDLQDEVIAIETALGVNPQGTASSLAARVAALTTSLNNLTNSVAALPVAPTGLITPTAATTAPTGWLKCDGTEGPSADGMISRATYPALFALIGTRYGSFHPGQGDEKFGLPNLAGVFVRGAGGAVGVGTITAGDTHSHGGATQNHTLTYGELAAHTHPGSTSPKHSHGISNHSHGISTQFATAYGPPTAGQPSTTTLVTVPGGGSNKQTNDAGLGTYNAPNDTNDFGVNVASDGLNQGHNHPVSSEGVLLPPSHALLYIIKA